MNTALERPPCEATAAADKGGMCVSPLTRLQVCCPKHKQTHQPERYLQVAEGTFVTLACPPLRALQHVLSYARQ